MNRLGQLLALAAVLVLARSADAQTPPGQQVPPTPVEPEEPPEPEPPEEPDPRPPEPEPYDQPPPPPPAVEVVGRDAADTDRPTGMVFGIGLGYDLPADVQAPNTTSVRLRLASGITLEPVVTVALSGTHQEDEFGESDNGQFELSAGTNLRYPRQIRGPVDFLLVGGAGFGIISNDPDGSDNDTTTMFAAITWGIGLEYWFSPHWSLSATATNPFLLYTRTSQEQGPGDDAAQSSSQIGVIWEPNIVVMGHLYF